MRLSTQAAGVAINALTASFDGGTEPPGDIEKRPLRMLKLRMLKLI